MSIKTYQDFEREYPDRKLEDVILERLKEKGEVCWLWHNCDCFGGSPAWLPIKYKLDPNDNDVVDIFVYVLHLKEWQPYDGGFDGEFDVHTKLRLSKTNFGRTWTIFDEEHIEEVAQEVLEENGATYGIENPTRYYPFVE